MTMLCLWFSLAAVKNIPSKLSSLYVSADLLWMPDGGFVQDLTAEQARLAPEQSPRTQLLPFLPAAQHGKRGAARDVSVLRPRPQPCLQPFLFSIRTATRPRGLPLDTTASQERLCCAHPLTSTAHPWPAWLLLGWTQGSASPAAVLAVFSSSALSPTNSFVPMFLKPISLCNFPKLLGDLLSFYRFPFLISIYTQLQYLILYTWHVPLSNAWLLFALTYSEWPFSLLVYLSLDGSYNPWAYCHLSFNSFNSLPFQFTSA